jgi:hypothetical protein
VQSKTAQQTATEDAVESEKDAVAAERFDLMSVKEARESAPAAMAIEEANCRKVRNEHMN